MDAGERALAFKIAESGLGLAGVAGMVWLVFDRAVHPHGSHVGNIVLGAMAAGSLLMLAAGRWHGAYAEHRAAQVGRLTAFEAAALIVIVQGWIALGMVLPFISDAGLRQVLASGFAAVAAFGVLFRAAMSAIRAGLL